MDLSKVAAKALHNLVIKQSDSKIEDIVWQHDWLKKLDEILSSLGEELDSIMVSINFQFNLDRTLQMTMSLMRSKVSVS
jgi:hypothetical protein